MNTNAIPCNLHSEKTRVGIMKSKASGTAWGTYGRELAIRNKQGAAAFAETLRPILVGLIVDGVRGPTALAEKLNDLGVPTARGTGTWHPSSIHRLLHKLGPSLRAEVQKLIAVKRQEFLKTAGTTWDI